MGIKRKAPGPRNGTTKTETSGATELKPSARATTKPQRAEELVFSPRPDWHAAELPELETGQTAHEELSVRTTDEIHKHATSLLEAENERYASSQKSSSSSSQKFLSTIMASGTLEDKISALTLMVQESPLHAMKAFDNLIGLARKKSRNQALMAIAAVKDLLCQGMVLPADRKLRAFGKQPGLLGSVPAKIYYRPGMPLLGGVKDTHLMYWAYEDWLKKTYFEPVSYTHLTLPTKRIV